MFNLTIVATCFFISFLSVDSPCQKDYKQPFQKISSTGSSFIVSKEMGLPSDEEPRIPLIHLPPADTVVLKEGLVIRLKPNRDNIITPDAVAASVETGEWKTPAENESLKDKDKIIGTWKKINGGENGWFIDTSLYNSYVYFPYESSKDDIVLLEAMGNSMVYVNRTPRSGNPYRFKDTYEPWDVRFDYSLIPVKLKKGKNELLFKCDRKTLKVKIHHGKKGIIFNETDLTVPDIIVNETIDTYGGIPVVNATENFYKNLLVKSWAEGAIPEYYNVKQVNPLSIIKTPFLIKLPEQKDTGRINLNIALIEKINPELKEGGVPVTEKIIASSIIELKVVNKNDIHKETFLSRMDGSVQYYAVNPPEYSNNINRKEKPALFLSLHGAGVEAINQALAYGRKNWGYLVAPTNRRPYGYNWENWGRLDALEVLDIAKEKFNTDENRIYLTGHSMGGHGTWHLGINYPDRFAALGPSAGWISIWVYRIKGLLDSSEVKGMLTRSTKHSDTYAFSTNLKQNGIYIIHGDADDNVPPEQARSMVDNLSKFHKDFIYYEEPGAGHWWDNSDEPGADCVDWMPMFDYFAHRSNPGMYRTKMIDFVTANPAVSSKNYWIEIINQIRQQKISRVQIRLESGNRKFSGKTENIETLAIDASMLSGNNLSENIDPVSVELDNQLISGIKIPDGMKIYLLNENGKWKLIDEPEKTKKYPARCGNFREVLNNQIVFVYGTNGNKEENKWALEKARYDAEKIWYQGNGSVEVIKDDDFNLESYKDRNVVLFGNSKTNSAWNLLLKDSPVQVENNKIIIGDKKHEGNDLSCLMIYPRTDSEISSVGIVSGTGIKGMRQANFADYHHPYMSLPDIVVYNSKIIDSDDDGVLFTGYFDNNWSLEEGEFIGEKD
jgi:pimeloyl-ACP methyl ester carboxylesterase